MKRDLLKTLQAWKNAPQRKPLVIRGARQVGKTWLVRNFGKSDYSRFVEINFDLQPSLKSCFDDVRPAEICKCLELSANVEINPSTTLLFLDEIQECPNALKALRYFYELMPELSIIAAGSLLEFINESETLSMPVGRIANYYLHPLSFGEFLTACNEERLRTFLGNLSLSTIIPEAITTKAMSLLRTYLYTGGMPAAINSWLLQSDLAEVDSIHRSLFQNYRHDFGKYGKRANYEMLEKSLLKIPGLVGTSFSYSAIDSLSHSRVVRQAVELLEKAGICLRVFSSSGAGLPFHTYINEGKFKILFLDVGLLQNTMGISRETYLATDLFSVYKGSVTEQFIGQQLLAKKLPYEDPELFYWRRNKPGSDAEVDYLIQRGGTIFPIEVKSGTTGTLKSLQLFIKEHNSKLGIRLSLHPLSLHNAILSIPLFAIESLDTLIEQALLSRASLTTG